MSDTYIVDGGLRLDGESYEPGDEIELSEEQADRLLALDPPPIREPGTGAPAPSRGATNPLSPETIAEIEAILPEIDDAGRLEAALEGEDRVGAVEAIESRLDELAEDEA